jgi:hypothetical protein
MIGPVRAAYLFKPQQRILVFAGKGTASENHGYEQRNKKCN